MSIKFSLLRRPREIVCTTCTAFLLIACGGSGAASPPLHPDAGGAVADHAVVAGQVVALSLSKPDQAQLDALSKQLKAVAKLSAGELLSQHSLKHVATLGYDPSKAAGLDTIQASTLSLGAADQAVLGQRGFVVSAAHRFPSMIYGYATLYGEDLPLYVSADSILDAVHRSYDAMLKQVEQEVLIAELDALLDGMRSTLAHGPKDSAAADADFFLAVAKGLLDGQAAAVVAGATQGDVDDFVARATAASGTAARTLFGVERDIDFSQFEPRGHYNETEQLQHYFRAMMWFGRTDLRLIETQPDGSQVFHRRQLEAVLRLHELVGPTDLPHFTRVDDALEAFVGKSDYMRLPQVASLLADLGAKDAAAVAKLSDQRIAQTIIDKGYGAQAIASQLMVNATADGHTLPLDRSFALFGQRFVLDSQVLSNVVYDRVATRLMPSPLDVAFAALHNDQAASLLATDLETHAYAPALEAVRRLADAHDASFWDANLYNLWLSALRALSPTPATADPKSAGLPTVTGTEAWGRRLLNTQLGSWAELRHDTILYAKQSYTGGIACVFPDAYVDPYPELYKALSRFAQHGATLADTLAGGADNAGTAQAIRLHFDHMRSTMELLAGMAATELAGQAFSAEQMAFINDAVHEKPERVCGAPPSFNGWYAKLLYGVDGSGEIAVDADYTIADVHTQPTDETGTPMGRILHVATGMPRLMVVTADTCNGPRAYAGLVLSYYEVTTEKYKRLTDSDWSDMVEGTPDVAWVRDFTPGARAGTP